MPYSPQRMPEQTPMMDSTSFDSFIWRGWNSLSSNSMPMPMITKPKITFTTSALKFFRKTVPTTLPTRTIAANGPQTFQSRDLRSRHAMMTLVGHPMTSSTGEMLMLLWLKLRIAENRIAFAKPQTPFTKKDKYVATIHQNMCCLFYLI